MRANILGLLLCAATSNALINKHGEDVRLGKLFVPGRSMKPPAEMGNATFTQPIDHQHPDLGTFEQTYWYSTEFWAGPGSPVVIFCPGEVAAEYFTGYLGNATLTGALAQKIGAATIVIEHRYWGYSSPFSNLTTANLQHLTLDNAILDLTNFANHVQLPFVERGVRSNADAVPWALVGGSYSGALTAWTEAVAPGTFWAYLASSAVVQTVSDFWTYFEPIQEGMPKNCSADVNRVIDYMDNILVNGTSKQKSELKAMFDLEGVQHDDDFMAALMMGPWSWQSNEFFSAGGFYQWCDYIENAQDATTPASLPGPNGVGLQKALKGYANWWNSAYGDCVCGANACGDYSCLDTYDARNPMYTDYTVAGEGRQWEWMLCNEPFGWWQDGAPRDRPTLVSRLITADYWIRQCGLYFPTGPKGETYGLNKGVTEANTNRFTGGWNNTRSTRLTWTNGQYDPWRSATVSSDYRTGGPLVSKASEPINIIPGGVHCYDLLMENGQANAGCQKVIDTELAQMATWIKEFPPPYST